MTFEEKKSKKAKDVIDETVVGPKDVAQKEVEKMLESGLKVFVETDSARYIIEKKGSKEKVMQESKKTIIAETEKAKIKP